MWLVRLTAALCVAFGLLTVGFLFRPGEAASTCSMTLAEFNSLQPGVTTYRDAVSVVGCEGSVASKSVTSGYSTVMYTWTGSGSVGANANAMFQNDSLVTKAQFGLH